MPVGQNFPDCRGCNANASGTEGDFVRRKKNEVAVIGAKTARGTYIAEQWSQPTNCVCIKPDFALKSGHAREKLKTHGFR
jgi:hypothetical protein